MMVALGIDGDAFQDFADFGGQGFQVEGLLQEVQTIKEVAADKISKLATASR